MKQVLFITIFFSFLVSNAFSQNQRPVCGMHGEELVIQRKRAWEMQKRLRSADQANKSEDTYFIPVKFHLVADDNGEGRILEHHVLQQVCWLNEAYEPYNIQFFIKDGSFNYIDNEIIFDNPGSQGAELRMVRMRDDEAMNIFLTDKANTGGTLGTTLGYYSPSRDWVVIKNDQMNDGYNSVVGHEVGHFFSLLHPHNGWDSEVWEEARHGNPVNVLTVGGVEVECQNGSNCEIAGDFLCDTPPDYNFGFGHPDCVFELEVGDPCGDIVDPMEVNFMAYFLSCDDFVYEMTPQQAEQMIENIESSDRDYLQNDYAMIGDPGTFGLLSPSNGSVLEINENIGFDWEDAANATAYLLQVSTRNSFSDPSIVYSALVKESYALVDQLQENTQFYYRVIPINEYRTCPDYAELDVKEFTTGLGTFTRELNPGFQVSLVDQVVQRGQNIRLQYETDRDREIRWQIINSSGVLLAENETTFKAHGSQYTFNGLNLDRAGVYFMHIESENAGQTYKFVVQ